MILDVPDVRQRHDFDCGAACLETVFRFHGLPKPRWVSALATPIDGMSPETVRAVASAVFGSVVSGHLTVGLLDGFVRDGKPVIAHATFADGIEHWVVVVGVTRARVHFHCPTDGRDSLSLADWDAVWRDDGGRYRRYGVTGWPD